MSEVIFSYVGKKTIIQCNEKDKIKDICQRFAFNIGTDINKLYFLYGGNTIEQNMMFSEIINEADKERNKMSVLVNDIEKTGEEKNKKLVKAKEVICPKCYESILLNLKDYKINLYNCKNGHQINNIFLNEFENTQNIDISKIICGKCDNNKGSTYNNEFFKCCSCGINLCPLCKSLHDKTHKIINYEQKYYICENHCDIFIKYCKDCKLNLCITCEKDHKSHDIIYFGDIIPNKDDLLKEITKLKNNINKFNNDVKTIITKLINVTKTMKTYYFINNNIINDYDIQNKNYQILHNIHELNIYSNKIIQDMNKMINENDIFNKINILLEMDYKMNNIIENIRPNNIKKKTVKFNKSTNFLDCKLDDKLNDKKINKSNKQLEEIGSKSSKQLINLYDKLEDSIDGNKLKEYKYKLNYEFTKNPQDLKYKLDITNSNYSKGVNDIFEVFLSYKDNKEYLVSPNINNYNLDLFLLNNFKKIYSFEKHKNNVKSLRYFINYKDYNEYLISGDDDGLVIIWDITNDFNIKYEIKTNYDKFIYSCLLVFPHNTNDDYIITSTFNTSKDIEKSCKIYSLKTGKFIRLINDTNRYEIIYLLSWLNKYNNKYYVIMLLNKKIIINNLLEDELYAELINEPEGCHNSGFMYNKENIEYLCSSSTNGYINFWNLYDKNLIKVINITKCWLMHIIQWNNKYIIVADLNNKSFKIIDFEKNDVVSEVNGVHKNYVTTIKKIYHPTYGEILLSGSWDNTIKLWVI